ncbi:hypothetical protein [Listeria seeligeri]|nr:hypothetical protein [Listeria seeligeri]MBC1746900.1 hypothetical protein [Listeria seeligeri]MBC2233039.1 hypothetical protein [Listeria seeligeri]MBF2626131.1 hypothetical protein [Listeria seeligeri]MBF2673475.1 hypothetical protein [Listeria seeligeri]
MIQAVMMNRKKRWICFIGILLTYLFAHIFLGFSIAHVVWKLVQVATVGILVAITLRIVWPFILAGAMIMILSYF